MKEERKERADELIAGGMDAGTAKLKAKREF